MLQVSERFLLHEAPDRTAYKLRPWSSELVFENQHSNHLIGTFRGCNGVSWHVTQDRLVSNLHDCNFDNQWVLGVTALNRDFHYLVLLRQSWVIKFENKQGNSMWADRFCQLEVWHGFGNVDNCNTLAAGGNVSCCDLTKFSTIGLLEDRMRNFQHVSSQLQVAGVASSGSWPWTYLLSSQLASAAWLWLG